MRLYFMLERRVSPLSNPVLVEVVDILSRREFDVSAGVAEEMVTRSDRLNVHHDLYVLESQTELSLSLAGVLDAKGARLLNPYRSCVATQDKLVAARRLRAAAIATPRCWVTGDLSLLRGVAEDMPLVVKPHRGHRGAGIYIVDGADELAALRPPEVPVLVQEHVPGPGEDLKVYVVGGEVFAVRKGARCTPSATVREIAQRCGRTLGLGLYGLDIIESPKGPVVVDVNSFPGYEGLPDVAPLIADYIEGYALGRHTLALPKLPAAAGRGGSRLRQRRSARRARVRGRGESKRAPGRKPVKRRFAKVNPSLAAIVVEGLLSRFAFGLVTFALPLYAFRELGLSLTQVGLLASFNLMVAVALKPLMGSLADRVGLKPGLQAAIGMRSLVSLLLVFAHVPWQLFAIRGLHGVSISLRDPSVNALIAEHGGKKAIASAFAWYQTAKSIGGAAGKVMAGVVLGLTASNFSLVFLLAFALSTVPLLVVSRYLRAPELGEEEQDRIADAVQSEVAHEGLPATSSPSEAPGQVRPPIFRFMGLGFFISGTAYMLTNLFPIFAVEYAGLTEAQAGLIYAVSSLMALTGPGFGWLSDNVSRKLVLSLRSAANVLSSVIYLVAPSFGGLAAGRALDDAGKAAFRPAWGALMAHVSGYDRRRRARAMGYMSSGEDAGEIAGPILASALWSMWGVPVLLGVRIAMAVVTELYTVALSGSLKKLDSQAAARSPAMPGSVARNGGSNGRPRFSSDVRERIVEIARSKPGDLDKPFTHWSLAKLRDHLVETGVVSSISSETVRRILAERGVSLQRETVR